LPCNSGMMPNQPCLHNYGSNIIKKRLFFNISFMLKFIYDCTNHSAQKQRGTISFFIKQRGTISFFISTKVIPPWLKHEKRPWREMESRFCVVHNVQFWWCQMSSSVFAQTSAFGYFLQKYYLVDQ